MLSEGKELYGVSEEVRLMPLEFQPQGLLGILACSQGLTFASVLRARNPETMKATFELGLVGLTLSEFTELQTWVFFHLSHTALCAC